MASLAGLSASVTRILFLTGFSKELKTKDIQSAFSEWESVSGGFKIKWKDDTSLLIVFQDAATAKRAYLHTLAYPPAILTSADGVTALIKPYDGPDAQTVIQNVNARGQNLSRHNSRSASISVFPNSAASRVPNAITPSNSFRNGLNGVAIPEFQPQPRDQPSPTLPNLPSHPTLNALISSSLGEGVTNQQGLPADPAILATSISDGMNGMLGGPRIGDPGKRMLGAALGVRHPGLGPRSISGEHGMKGIERAMGGLVVAE